MNKDHELSPEIGTHDWEGVSPIGYITLIVLIVLVGEMGIFVFTGSV